MALLDIEDQLCFYRAYHYNLTNVLIHLFFIPVILFSSVGFLSAVRFDRYIDLPGFVGEPYAQFIKTYVFNLGSALIISFSTFYVFLDHVSGVIFSAIILSVSYAIESLYKVYPADQIVKTSIVAHVVAWLAQFLGHGVFEHRAPALLDNLLQALVLAPFFVFFEAQFFLGFKKDLKRRMDARAEAMIADFKARKTQ